MGAPRSGTTLLRLILDSHPDLALPPETHFLPEAIGRAEGAGRPSAARVEFLASVTGFETFPDFQLSPDELSVELSRLEPFDLSDGVRTFYRLYAARFGKSRFGDKTPDYGFHLPLLARVLPEARFVHLVRDGRDVAASLRDLWFAPSRDPADLAHDWCRRVRAARCGGALVSHYLEVRFEELVNRPEQSLREICRFLGLEYFPEMLDFHRRAPARLAEHLERRRTDGSLVLSREQRLAQQRRTTTPIDPSRCGVHREIFDESERAQFESVAGELLRELDYA